MAHEQHTYICVDLKTFYASVECVDRGLDPLTTCLVVADESRGRTTICLAITQAMKDLGIHNRCRLFEIPDGIDCIKAVPRMQHYMEVSAKIYGIYLEYVSPQDIHVYSIDECFIDVTPYLDLYHTDAEGFACTLRDEVLARTGITATVGIGPNLFQAKVALDITAKHVPSRIGILDDGTFRKEIWPHRPITDIWGIGPGVAARLEKYGVYDLMGVAALDENLLYDELGVNAEYLIDHAFGREPTTIADIQAYRPQATSTTTGQVLSKGYAYEQAYTVLREMVDNAVLDLVDKHVVCDSISLFVGYASERADIRRLNASGAAQYIDDSMASMLFFLLCDGKMQIYHDGRLYYLAFSDRDMDQTLYLALNLGERKIIGINLLYQVAAYGGEIWADESRDANTAQSRDIDTAENIGVSAEN